MPNGKATIHTDVYKNAAGDIQKTVTSFIDDSDGQVKIRNEVSADHAEREIQRFSGGKMSLVSDMQDGHTSGRIAIRSINTDGSSITFAATNYHTGDVNYRLTQSFTDKRGRLHENVNVPIFFDGNKVILGEDKFRGGVFGKTFEIEPDKDVPTQIVDHFLNAYKREQLNVGRMYHADSVEHTQDEYVDGELQEKPDEIENKDDSSHDTRENESDVEEKHGLLERIGSKISEVADGIKSFFTKETESSTDDNTDLSEESSDSEDSEEDVQDEEVQEPEGEEEIEIEESDDDLPQENEEEEYIEGDIVYGEQEELADDEQDDDSEEVELEVSDDIESDEYISDDISEDNEEQTQEEGEDDDPYKDFDKYYDASGELRIAEQEDTDGSYTVYIREDDGSSTVYAYDSEENSFYVDKYDFDGNHVSELQVENIGNGEEEDISLTEYSYNSNGGSVLGYDEDGYPKGADADIAYERGNLTIYSGFGGEETIKLPRSGDVSSAVKDYFENELSETRNDMMPDLEYKEGESAENDLPDSHNDNDISNKQEYEITSNSEELNNMDNDLIMDDDSSSISDLLTDNDAEDISAGNDSASERYEALLNQYGEALENNTTIHSEMFNHEFSERYFEAAGNRANEKYASSGNPQDKAYAERCFTKAKMESFKGYIEEQKLEKSESEIEELREKIIDFRGELEESEIEEFSELEKDLGLNFDLCSEEADAEITLDSADSAFVYAGAEASEADNGSENDSDSEQRCDHDDEVNDDECDFNDKEYDSEVGDDDGTDSADY